MTPPKPAAEVLLSKELKTKPHGYDSPESYLSQKLPVLVGNPVFHSYPLYNPPRKALHGVVARVFSPLIGLKSVYFLQGGPLIVRNGVVGVITPTTGVMGSYLQLEGPTLYANNWS